MAQVVNEFGEIKCIDDKGNIKWLSKFVVEQSSVLKDYNIVVFDAPEPLPAVESKEKSIDDYTKNELIELLKGKAEFKVTDNKETLFNLLTNLK